MNATRGTCRRALWRLYSGARGLMAAAVALSVVQAAALLPIALVVREIFDHQVPDGDTTAIVRSGGLVIVLYLAGVAVSLAAQRAALIATARGVAALRTASLEALELAPISWYDARQTARLQSDLTIEGERAERVGDPLVAILRAVVVGLPLQRRVVAWQAASRGFSATLLSGIEARDPPVTLVVITHDAALAQTMDRVVRLERGRIVAEDAGLRA